MMPFRHLRRLKVTATSKACGTAYASKAARKGSPYSPMRPRSLSSPGRSLLAKGNPLMLWWLVGCWLLPPALALSMYLFVLLRGNRTAPRRSSNKQGDCLRQSDT